MKAYGRVLDGLVGIYRFLEGFVGIKRGPAGGLLGIWITLTVVNFVYEALHSHNWGEAANLSKYQGLAIFLVWGWLRGNRPACEALIGDGTSPEAGPDGHQHGTEVRPWFQRRYFH